jgi:hypothetical protein
MESTSRVELGISAAVSKILIDCDENHNSNNSMNAGEVQSNCLENKRQFCSVPNMSSMSSGSSGNDSAFRKRQKTNQLESTSSGSLSIGEHFRMGVTSYEDGTSSSHANAKFSSSYHSTPMMSDATKTNNMSRGSHCGPQNSRQYNTSNHHCSEGFTSIDPLLRQLHAIREAKYDQQQLLQTSNCAYDSMDRMQHMQQIDIRNNDSRDTFNWSAGGGGENIFVGTRLMPNPVDPSMPSASTSSSSQLAGLTRYFQNQSLSQRQGTTRASLTGSSIAPSMTRSTNMNGEDDIALNRWLYRMTEE